MVLVAKTTAQVRMTSSCTNMFVVRSTVQSCFEYDQVLRDHALIKLEMTFGQVCFGADALSYAYRNSVLPNHLS